MVSTRNFALFAAAACFLGVASGYRFEHEEHHEPQHEPHYSYEYSVYDPHTHDFKSQEESRKGDQVKGYYKLKEADGSLREVHYTADHHGGFSAYVTKDGQPLQEQPQPQEHQAVVHHVDKHGHHGATSSQHVLRH